MVRGKQGRGDWGGEGWGGGHNIHCGVLKGCGKQNEMNKDLNEPVKCEMKFEHEPKQKQVKRYSRRKESVLVWFNLK
jgi:hypothetical protein